MTIGTEVTVFGNVNFGVKKEKLNEGSLEGNWRTMGENIRNQENTGNRANNCLLFSHFLPDTLPLSTWLFYFLRSGCSGGT